MLKFIMLSSVLLWTTVAQAVNLDMSGVAIERYEASGDCRTQDISVTLSPDASYISVLYNNLTLSANQSNQNQQKNCSVEIFFKKPKIKTIFGRIKTAYSIESVDYRGYLYLARNASASQEVKVENGYSDVGKVFINFANKQWTGPWEEDYFLRANYPVAASGYKYLGCLNADKDVARIKFKTKISLNHRNAYGSSYFAVDSADATAQRIEHRYYVKWISVVDCLNALLSSPALQPQPNPQPGQPTQPTWPDPFAY